MSAEEFDVPAAGGPLRVCRWPGDGPAVLAVHGITANALSFTAVAQALAGKATVIAPDLRGRAASAHLPGPYGLAAHTDDLIATLDYFSLSRVLVIGHSMGAFVAALAAVRHPQRVASVLLVDGGVALTVPHGADIDAILAAVIGPAMDRLRTTFDSPQSYVDFWQAHPALSAAWSPWLSDYVLRDLVGHAPAMRSSCNLDAVRADASDTLLDPHTTTAVHHVTQPMRLLWAPRGIMNEPQGLYDDQRLKAIAPALQATRVEGTNHYTILLSATGAAAVATHAEQLLGSSLPYGAQPGDQ